MKRILAIVAACCAFALALGLVGCGGSSAGSAAASGSGTALGSSSAAETSASSAGASASGASAVVTVDVKPEYLDGNGGITLNAVLDLTGPELEALLQQGYEWVKGGFTGWQNATTGDNLTVRSVDDKLVKEDGYGSATEKGALAEGHVRITTHAYALETTDDLAAVRDAMLAGCTVEDSWQAGFGAYLYSVVADASGERYIIVVIANDENEAQVEFKTDAYLEASGDGGVDGYINSWKN